MIDPGVLAGKPIVKGTRLTVEFIIDLLAQGWTGEEILRNYPGLTRTEIIESEQVTIDRKWFGGV